MIMRTRRVHFTGLYSASQTYLATNFSLLPSRPPSLPSPPPSSLYGRAPPKAPVPQSLLLDQLYVLSVKLMRSRPNKRLPGPVPCKQAARLTLGSRPVNMCFYSPWRLMKKMLVSLQFALIIYTQIIQSRFSTVCVGSITVI